MQPPGGALPRASLFAACVLHAALFGWAAVTLPWKQVSLWSVFFGVLAASHALTALGALLPKQRLLWLAFRALSLLSALAALLLTWVVLSSSLYLLELYRSLGQLLVTGLLVAWLLLLALTVPMAIWGLVRVWREVLANERAWWLFGLALAAVVLSALWVGRSARAQPLHAESDRSLEDAIRRAWARRTTARAASTSFENAPSLFTEQPATCAADPRAAPFTALATYAPRDGQVSQVCVQGRSLGELLARLDPIFGEARRQAKPVKLDVLTAAQRLGRSSLLDPLKLRPALDGVCAGERCLSAWQLVALDAFAHYRPFPAVKDASFGVSMPWLAQKLRAKSPSELARIEAESFVLDDTGVQRLLRMRVAPGALQRPALERAVFLAQEHILRSQRESGEFRYLLDPFRGTVEDSNFNLPRQAGTLLILCEHDRSAGHRAIIQRGLELLRQNERRVGHASSLSQDHERTRLGQSALPLVAFLSCRPKLGTEYDALIARLGQFLLRMQRADGSFYPEFDYATKSPLGRHEALYSAGQAVLALVLLEQNWPELSDKAGLNRTAIGLALERAMNFYSGPYWPAPLRDLFFVEENWHCLAARAALASRRHDAYERFCLDYVRFKSRLILDKSTGNEDLQGAYGISPALPVHNTATAGFGEALAAAVSVKRARGEATAEDESLLKRVLGFLLASQWQSANCFACTRQHFVLGGFSEHFAGPVLRIDYVQHAMAALHHGARAVYGK
ncbi:MAG TPA: hypothetical protein VK524_12475 [Polyangiaceae bacterium]|nr:hypothetical protein [Polyangiaceae bacterium]